MARAKDAVANFINDNRVDLQKMYGTTRSIIQGSESKRDAMIEAFRDDVNLFFQENPRKVFWSKNPGSVNKATPIIFARYNLLSTKRQEDQLDRGVNLYRIRLNLCLGIKKGKSAYGRFTKSEHLLKSGDIYLTRDFTNGRHAIEPHHLEYLEYIISEVNKFNIEMKSTYDLLITLRDRLNNNTKQLRQK